MKNIWYTIAGEIKKDETAQVLIGWANNQIYNFPETEKLVLFISSKGGDLDTAIRIYSYLKGLPIEVETIGFGQIDSAAIVIFLSGKNRMALAESRFILHRSMYSIGLQSSPIEIYEQTVSILRELNDKHIQIIAKETSKTPKEIESVMIDGKILSPEKAMKLGIVTEIITELPKSPKELPRQATPPPQQA